MEIPESNSLLLHLGLDTFHWIICTASLFVCYQFSDSKIFAMVYTLNIIDTVFSTEAFGREIFFFTDDTPTALTVFSAISSLGFYLSLFWSTAIAISFYITSKEGGTELTKFPFQAFMVCILLSGLFPFMISINAWDIAPRMLDTGGYTITYPTYGDLNRALYILTFDFIGIVIPSTIMLVCYYKVFQAISAKRLYNLTLRKFRVFAAVIVICLLSIAVVETVCVCKAIVKPSVLIVSFTAGFRRLWGLLNLIVYKFLKPPVYPSSVVSDQKDTSKQMYLSMSQITADAESLLY